MRGVIGGSLREASTKSLSNLVRSVLWCEKKDVEDAECHSRQCVSGEDW